MNTSRFQEQGFTLLEIIVALLIFSIGIFAFLGLQMKATETNILSSNHTTAVSLTESKIETLKQSGYTTLVTGSHSDPLNPLDEEGANGGKFTRAWLIAATPFAGDLKQITVTTSWIDSSGNHEVALTTIVSLTVDGS